MMIALIKAMLSLKISEVEYQFRVLDCQQNNGDYDIKTANIIRGKLFVEYETLKDIKNKIRSLQEDL